MAFLMKCGHVANATCDGKLCCVICTPDTKAHEIDGECKGSDGLDGRMAAEIWKPIQGYVDLYEISNRGNVRNVRNKKMKTPQTTNTNYYQVLLWSNHQPKAFYIHRLVAMAFIENPNNYCDVNHKDGNKHNNAVENLEWCSRSYNLKHAYATGLRKSSNQKLSIDDVNYIKNNPLKLSRQELAEKFNVSYWCICDVLQHKSFKTNEVKYGC